MGKTTNTYYGFVEIEERGIHYKISGNGITAIIFGYGPETPPLIYTELFNPVFDNLNTPEERLSLKTECTIIIDVPDQFKTYSKRLKPKEEFLPLFADSKTFPTDMCKVLYERVMNSHYLRELLINDPRMIYENFGYDMEHSAEIDAAELQSALVNSPVERIESSLSKYEVTHNPKIRNVLNTYI
jgi:hypothetical protein